MGAMSTGDERLESVGESIEDAKKAADKVSDQEDLELRHREEPDPTANHGAGEDIDDAGEEKVSEQALSEGKPGEAKADEGAAADDESGEADARS
jgi:hypothetical protein